MRHRNRTFYADPHLLDGAVAWLLHRRFYLLSMGADFLWMEVAE